jgi:hypothetical protein
MEPRNFSHHILRLRIYFQIFLLACGVIVNLQFILYGADRSLDPMLSSHAP